MILHGNCISTTPFLQHGPLSFAQGHQRIYNYRHTDTPSASRSAGSVLTVESTTSERENEKSFRKKNSLKTKSAGYSSHFDEPQINHWSVHEKWDKVGKIRFGKAYCPESVLNQLFAFEWMQRREKGEQKVKIRAINTANTIQRAPLSLSMRLWAGMEYEVREWNRLYPIT